MNLFLLCELMGERRMVVMYLRANNLYDFNNFEMDFSYPKKIVGSTLEKEWLKD